MNRIILFIFFYIIFNSLKAQIKLDIENIRIGYYNVDFTQEEIDEDMENGPYVHFQCILRSVRDSIKIMPSEINVEILFYYEKLLFQKKVIIFPWEWENNNFITIGKEGIKFECGTLLMNDACLFEDKKGDYREELLKIIPTIKIVFQDRKSNMTIISESILNVTLQ